MFAIIPIVEISEKKIAQSGRVVTFMQIYEITVLSFGSLTLSLQTAGEITPTANAAANDRRNETDVSAYGQLRVSSIAASPSEVTVWERRRKSGAASETLVMMQARVTDGEKPAKSAKLQIKAICRAARARTSGRGRSSRLTNIARMTTCRPETAKMCPSPLR